MSVFLLAAPELYKLLLGVWLVLAWWLFMVEYRKYRVDLLRQQLFVVRSALFFKARDGDFFDAPAYGITRMILNGGIRFAHELSFMRVVVMFATAGRDHEATANYRRFVEEAIAKLPPSAREAVAEALVAMHMAMLAHVVKTSIVLAPFFYLARPIARRLDLAATMKRRLVTSPATSDSWAVIDAEVAEIGQQVEARKELLAA